MIILEFLHGFAIALVAGVSVALLGAVVVLVASCLCKFWETW